LAELIIPGLIIHSTSLASIWSTRTRDAETINPAH
jgi:hypothetical protein